MLLSLGRMQFVLPALVIWALWAWRTRHTFAAQFTALLIGVAAAAHILQWGGDGVVGNSQFDLVIATATGLGLAYEHAAVPALTGTQCGFEAASGHLRKRGMSKESKEFKGLRRIEWAIFGG